jgi:hypothetical protein
MSSNITHFDPEGSKTYPFTTAVEILLGGVARAIYPDGTQQFMDQDEQPFLVFSPRLSPTELEQFCEAHLHDYQNFYNQYSQALDRYERVPMDSFWE